jgi:Tfp pilus assembly protein PilO
MSTTVFFATQIIIFGTVLTVFAMKYVTATRTAQAQIAANDAYKALAEKAAAAGAEAAAALAAIKADMAETKSRLAAIEKVLKEVE